jgi:hypothetical protein
VDADGTGAALLARLLKVDADFESVLLKMHFGKATSKDSHTVARLQHQVEEEFAASSPELQAELKPIKALISQQMDKTIVAIQNALPVQVVLLGQRKEATARMDKQRLQ